MIGEVLERIWAIAKKDVRIYYFKGPVIIFGLLLPLFLYSAYALGRNMTLEEAVSSVLSMTVFFTSTAVGPVIAPWETRSRTFERLISSPVNIAIILFGDALASIIFTMLITSSVVVFSLLMGVYVTSVPLFTLNLFLSAICFSFFGLLLSSPPEDTPANIMMLSSLLKFPMIFVSGIFLPINKMPTPLKIIALISPLTYTTDIFRKTIYNKNILPTQLAITILTIYAIIFIITAIKLHERNAHKRL